MPKAKKVLKIMGVVLCAAILMSLGALQSCRLMVEKPDFRVVEKSTGYAIREYPACVVAQVTVPKDTDEPMSRGFGPLANYIFGKNVAETKIAMTSPVTSEQPQGEKIAMTSPVTQESGAEGHVVSFIMPSEYTLEDLPQPLNDAVRLEAIPARTLAVRRFGWTGNAQAMQQKEQDLRDALERDGITVTGPAIYARYDPPWTLPPFRRNEVMLPVELEDAETGAGE
ncbi:MAG: SOUL family heme-binding protein [Candidatus Hydrogenedentota bacterium]